MREVPLQLRIHMSATKQKAAPPRKAFPLDAKGACRVLGEELCAEGKPLPLRTLYKYISVGMPHIRTRPFVYMEEDLRRWAKNFRGGNWS